MKVLSGLAALPGKAVDTAIQGVWLLAHKTYRLAEWVERFEPKPETIARAEKLRLVEGEG